MTRRSARDGAAYPERMILIAAVALSLCAQSPAERRIRAVLDQQVADWNRGDIKAFMDGYEASDDILFVGKAITRGYAETLAQYVKRYPDKARMGTLRFAILEIRLLGKDHALVLGRFHLARAPEAGGVAEGVFTLTFRKTQAGWKIIADHTS